MPITRKLLLALIVATFAAGSLAGPAMAASSTRLAIVNGVPGSKIDVCVNGKEVRSGLPYGKKVFRTTKTSKATVKFFARNGKRCAGRLLGKSTIGLADATVVLTKRKPHRIVVFDNADIEWIYDIDAGLASTFAMRHAADLGALTFKYDADGLDLDPVVPAFDPTWQKGDQTPRRIVGVYGHSFMAVFVTRPAQYDPFVEPDVIWLRFKRRYEWIVVGTTRKNARIVRIVREARVVPI